MKKVLVLTVALLFVAGVAFGASVVNSKHDMRGFIGVSATSTEVCVYCHTPHGADINSTAPLWNHTATTATYTMYSSATINGTVAATPSGVSLACLGCHDGTVAVNNLVNQPNLGSTGNPTFLTNASTALLDTDLRNDHPISITYNTADTGLRANANATVTNGGNTLQLFGTGPYTVECGSCHQVHDNTNVPFLRIPNTNSQLCLVCHDK